MIRIEIGRSDQMFYQTWYSSGETSGLRVRKELAHIQMRVL